MLFKPFFSQLIFLSTCFISLYGQPNAFSNPQGSSISNFEEMQQNLDIISHTFRINYAPAWWKGEQFNWQLDEAILKAKNLIAENTTPKDFQVILKNFLGSLKDYHVGIHFISTESATLPFNITTHKNRFFVSRVYKLLSPKIPLTLERGDEILSIDNIPITKLFEDFVKTEYETQPIDTDLSLALDSFTQRSGTNLNVMPENKDLIQITIRKTSTNKIETIPVQWMYVPELMPLKKGIAPFLKRKQTDLSQVLEKDNMLTHRGKVKQNSDQIILSKVIENYFNDNWKNILNLAKTDTSKSLLDDEKKQMLEEFVYEYEGSLLPPLGKVLWKSEPENYFQAAIYQLPTKEKIGFIRLRTFSPENTVNLMWHVLKGAGLANAPWIEFAELIQRFQTQTNALVIDQTENTGGSFLYMLGIISMLTDKPLDIPKHYLTITSRDVEQAISILEDLDEEVSDNNDAINQLKRIFGSFVEDETLHGYTITPTLVKQMKSFEATILEHWEKGITYTEPLHLHGIDKVLPHPSVRYTKPLVILVNSLDFSCADMLPAIMQDTKRAIIFGEKTAGAGGAVSATGFINRMNIAGYSFTTTLAMRGNNQPIENLGVTPDVPYSPTGIDMKNGYHFFVKKLNETLISLIRNK